MNFPELPSLDAMKGDLSSLGSNAVNFAREKLLRPAAEALRNSRGHLTDSVDDARQALVSQRDRTAQWVRANPFTALGLALGAGALLAVLRRKN